MSLLLFLLITEVLSRILKKTKDSGLIWGFHVGPINSTTIRISHLLFTDGILLLCDASREQLLSIRFTLSCIQALPI